MKTLLVLCTLLAAAYCESIEIVFHDNCIGIKHSSKVEETSDSNEYVDSGSWIIAEICCDQPFDTNTQIEGFNNNMDGADILSLIDVNFNKLSEGKTNCIMKQSGVA